MLVVMPVLVEELLADVQEERARIREVISYRCKSSTDTRSHLLGRVASKTFLNLRGKEENGRKAQCKYRLRFTIEAGRSVGKVKLTPLTQIKCHKAHIHNASFSINLVALFVRYQNYQEVTHAQLSELL